MKSGYGCVPQVSKWRLKKTLKRHTEFRPIENDDVKYVWAAYKKGGLKDLQIPDGLDSTEFKEQFERFVLSNSHAAWTLFADTKIGFVPIGLIFCAWSPFQTHMIIVGIGWYPWASKRNMVESLAAFFSAMRKQINFMGYALPEHKRMYEVGAMHGICRRVGTSYIAIPGKSVAVFETRPN